MVAELRTRGIGFTSPHESLDTLRRPARLPRLRRARGVHPRTHRHRHQGGPGRRTRPRPGRRTPQRRHRGDHPRRPRSTPRPRPLHHLNRQAPRRLPGHALQPHPGPSRTARRRRPPSARSPRAVAGPEQDQSQRHFLYRNYSRPVSARRRGEPVLVRRFRNPRRTRSGVSLSAGARLPHGRRRSTANGRASQTPHVLKLSSGARSDGPSGAGNAVSSSNIWCFWRPW